MNLLMIAIAAIFINNFILVQFLGLCPFFGVSKKTSSAIGMGLSVTFVMAAASLITWLVNRYLLIPFGLEKYMYIVAFILVIAAFVQLIEMVIKKLNPSMYKSMGIYLPLITTNCAVLGVATINKFNAYSLPESLVNGLCSGIGFTLALLMMSGVRERLELSDIPASFRNIPVAFLSAMLMAMSFAGFGGMVP